MKIKPYYVGSRYDGEHTYYIPEYWLHDRGEREGHFYDWLKEIKDMPFGKPRSIYYRIDFINDQWLATYNIEWDVCSVSVSDFGGTPEAALSNVMKIICEIKLGKYNR